MKAELTAYADRFTTKRALVDAVTAPREGWEVAERATLSLRKLRVIWRSRVDGSTEAEVIYLLRRGSGWSFSSRREDTRRG